MKYKDGDGVDRVYHAKLDVVQRAEERADVSIFAELVKAQGDDQKAAATSLMSGAFGRAKTLSSLLYESLPEPVRAEIAYDTWCAAWNYADFMAIMDGVISATFASMVDDTAPEETGAGKKSAPKDPLLGAKSTESSR